MIMSLTCPKNAKHESADSEYCSICGAKLMDAMLLSKNPARQRCEQEKPSADSALCPDCGIQRTRFEISFCQVCRYNYTDTDTGLEKPPNLRWVIVITVDASLNSEPDANVPCPTDEPERMFHLDLEESLIGRRSKSKEFHSDIPISDPGISHRHCKLVKEVDGSIALMDVGSTNGTQLNGNEAPPGVKMPLKSGDQITLGCWTRITIRKT